MEIPLPSNGSAANASAADPSHSPPFRRPRAPTITIDTSAVSPPPEEVQPQMADITLWPLSPSSSFSQRTHHHRTTSSMTEDSTRPALAPAASFESRGSRPTSPHNVSSPTFGGPDRTHNYLSVPSVARSRGNSIDSDDDLHSPTSYGGETVTAPSTPEGRDSRTVNERGNEAIMNDAGALTPDPGEEALVLDNKFAFTPSEMSKLSNPKSLPAFYAVSGLRGLSKGLRTNLQTGLSLDETVLEGSVSFEEAKFAASDESEAKATEAMEPPMSRKDTPSPAPNRPSSLFADRKRVFKENTLPEKKVKSIFQLAWIAFNDKVLILLSVAAVVSLALGLYQTFGQAHKEGEPSVEWVEGVAIMVAIIIVVVVGAANDWQKERQFVKLNKKKDDRAVRVIRSGKSREISVHELVVGDIMHLEPGDLIPVDGIFISGHNVRCDESSATGESDLLKKTPANAVYRAIESHEAVDKLDPFIISGAKVTEGIGTFLVTAVGVNSSYGKTLMSLQEDSETTPLQSKLNTLAEQIAKLGGAAALFLFVVLLIKFLANLPNNPDTPSERGQNFLQILIVAITIVVVAVPEGLPLAVTLALAFATTRMLKDNNLVRVLRACETMGNATTICSDKTGTLTQNEMSVVSGVVGTFCRFGDKPSPPSPPAAGDKPVLSANSPDIASTLPREFAASLSPEAKVLLEQSIAVNSTAFEGDDNGIQTFIGSKTETSLLNFARDHLGMGAINIVRSNANIVQIFPFDSARKCMATVVRLANGGFRMYVKGASEILLERCTMIIRDPTQNAAESQLTDEKIEALKNIISSYANHSLRTIALLYRDFTEWPSHGTRTLSNDPSLGEFDEVFKKMVFLGVVGIQDPLRNGVQEAVRKCQLAGVYVRMVTGDNVLTAKAIATECGIYTPKGEIMEGPAFRKLSRTQMDQVIPRLQVLARSSPEDKRTLVKRLKELGETVAVTGDGTNDAPALKTADIGFSMGIAGTEVAKEASSIILMDDNFSSIVKAIMWGRAVNDSVKKFLQFQITVNITAVLLTFVSAVTSDSEQSVLTAVQLLWVNLIMDTLAALALATDPPAPSILNRKPDPKSAPLITVTMWKMIIGQSIYQLAVTFTLLFGGRKIFSYTTPEETGRFPTFIFNTFVWMQIFNQLNNRRLDNRFNVFEGISRNWFFIAINVVIVGGQILIIFKGGAAFSVTPLNGIEWGYSLAFGALSMPIAIALRLIPDEFVAPMLPSRWHKRSTPQVVVSDDNQRFEWNQALEEIREELTFLKKVRGGRLNALKFKLKNPRDILPVSRSGSRSRNNSIPQTPTRDGHISSDFGSQGFATPESRRRRGRSRSNSAFGPAAAMAGIVAGSIGGWSPIERVPGDRDSLNFPRPANRPTDVESQEGLQNP
ncbi:MAG: hypothetical protein M1829_005771 [Trizodia sp. TS-e1964]|nr:MAG: hypothetical protein M1829_005771 [Trizodia sp. TS-e1964]